MRIIKCETDALHKKSNIQRVFQEKMQVLNWYYETKAFHNFLDKSLDSLLNILLLILPTTLDRIHRFVLLSLACLNFITEQSLKIIKPFLKIDRQVISPGSPRILPHALVSALKWVVGWNITNCTPSKNVIFVEISEMNHMKCRTYMYPKIIPSTNQIHFSS